MGRKYIIEIGRLERLYKAFISAHGKPEITWLSPEVDLTPYTEPDLEQIRKESYDKGYDDAAEEKYNDGLADAWEAARKICTNWVLPDSVLSKIFGIDKTIDDIMKENTASECIEKIRQYEQEKDRQARIEYNFDEIKDVLETTVKECNVSLDEIAAVLQKMRGSE